MLTTILATVVVLGVLIFVHELGHFVTAKMADIEVPRFSIGFGPRILGFKRGETEYVISLLPLGGYVKMAGMEEMEQIEGGVGDKPAEADDAAPRPRQPRDFESKSLPWRALVISAGVIMNLLFAFIVFAVIAAVWGVAADPDTRIGGVREELLTIENEVLAHIAPGTVVTAVNDEQVTKWSELQAQLIRARAGAARLTFGNNESIAFTLPSRDEDRGNLIHAFEPAVNVPSILSDVVANGPADRAGLRRGDRIVRAGDRDIATWQELVAAVEDHPGKPLSLLVDRDGERFETIITPHDKVLESGIHVGRIDVAVPYMSLEQQLPQRRLTIPQAIARGATDTWSWTSTTVDFLAGLFSGRQSARSLGGPIMIGQLSGQSARMGLDYFLRFMAILSINLAVLNLLPIPVLDGGHLVFLGIEGVRGKPLSFENRMRLTQVGFIIIIMLMVWAVGNDLLRVLGIG